MDKSVAEIFGDSIRVLKENWTTYLVLFLVMGLFGGAVTGFQFVLKNNSSLELLISIINGIVSAVVAVIYIGTSYNTLHPEKKYNISDLVREKIWKILLTQIIMFIIFFIPAFIVIFGLIAFIGTTGSIGAVMPTMLILILFMAAVVIKLIFVPHAIVLSDKQYWSAIKWSWQKTKGHVGKIILIGLTPALLGVLAFSLMRMDLMNIYLVTMLGIISGVFGVVIALAYSVLYIDVVVKYEEESPSEKTPLSMDFE